MEVCTEYRPIDEPPEENGFYLCRFLLPPNIKAHYRIAEWAMGGFWNGKLEMSSMGEIITHWAPIPTVEKQEVLEKYG